jgi:hypothetical protein
MKLAVISQLAVELQFINYLYLKMSKKKDPSSADLLANVRFQLILTYAYKDCK